MNKGGGGAYLEQEKVGVVSFCFNHICFCINNTLKLCILLLVLQRWRQS